MLVETDTPLRVLRRRLAPGVVEMARQGSTALAPEVLHEDVAYYRDPELFAREQRRLFREMPVVACLSSDLPEPGSFRTFDDTGVPILLTRAKDGQVRAFLNVCPHRAARVVGASCGKANRFTCRFHAWTYDNTGRNLGVPEEHYFDAETSANKNLTPVPAEERHGFVFVQATPGSVMDLDAFLGDFAEDLAILDLAHAERVHAQDIPVSANWKMGMDTFFETYHLNALHRETFKGFFSPICVFDTFGPHHRFTFAPLALDDWTRTPESEWDLDLLPLQYFLFPNTIMAVGSTSKSGTVINIHHIFPSSPGQFVSKMNYCSIGGVQGPEHRAEIDKAYEVTKVAIIQDDYAVTGEGHPGMLALPEGTRLPVGRQEIGVQNFHRNVRRFAGS
jgi:carnitine monooxygenase subunit